MVDDAQARGSDESTPQAGPPAKSRRRSPTSRDIAERAGVSRTVVSFVLNNRPHVGISDETRRRVLQAVAELGYRPNSAARSLVSGRTSTIGVVVNERRPDAYGDAFLPELLRGIDASCREVGYRMLLEYLGERQSENPYLVLLQEGRVDGLIVCGPHPDEQSLSQLVQSGAPAMIIGDAGDSGCPSVDVDNVEAAQQAVAHLCAHGYTRIALITNAALTAPSSRGRTQGYRRALAAARLPVDDSLIVEGDLDEASGRRGMSRLLGLVPRPDAVFAASDQIAVGALAALREAGLRAPEDVALVGFDDLALASLVHPALTTVRVPAGELGRSAGRRLVDQIGGASLEQLRLILPTSLVLRQSCGRHSAQGGDHGG